jgi:hypothetical protein
MTNRDSSLTTAQLGNIALGTDNHPKGFTPKLESVGQDVDERFYMLATFCFDLSRKLKYICLALREHWQDADPEFAKRILQDNELINPGPGNLSWEEMAKRAEDVMKGLWQEIRNEGFDQTLREIAGKAP